MKQLSFAIFFVAPSLAFTQIVIPSGTTLNADAGTVISIQTGSNIINNNTFDFSQAQLHLGLSGTNQAISGNLVTRRLQIAGGGIKTINGNLTITGQIYFNDGILKPGTGKVLFTGNADGILNAGSNSYTEGTFFNNSSGLLLFPVGTSGRGYAPAYIENGAGHEIGISVVNASPDLTPDVSAPELTMISNTHYWSVVANEITAFNSRISLSLTEQLPADLSPVVVEADNAGGIAFNLGNFSSTENSVTSVNAFQRKVLTIGGSTSVDIKIHDLISPHTNDGINDELYIENIGKFPFNRVTLLDRWGVLIKEWKNFTNFDDVVSPNQDGFNFSKLSPGNYICIVEYGSEGKMNKKKSQMITVLKLN